MLKITEFPKLCKCSVYTLRYYDQIEILKPSIIDTKSGYRFYDEKQLDDYIEIKDFQSIGFSMLEIQGFSSKTNNEILNMIATTSNDIYAGFTKNIKNLDFGGAIVTCYQLFNTSNFIDDIKYEFINTKLNEMYEEKINTIPKYYIDLIKDLKKSKY